MDRLYSLERLLEAKALNSLWRLNGTERCIIMSFISCSEKLAKGKVNIGFYPPQPWYLESLAISPMSTPIAQFFSLYKPVY